MSLVGLLSKIAGTLFGRGLVDTLVNSVSDWFKRKQVHKNELEVARHKARIAQIERDATMYGDADVESVKQWRYGYMDDLFKASILFLVICPFIPELRTYALESAAVLGEYPLWVQIIIVGTYMSVLGLRFLLLSPVKKFIEAKQNKKDVIYVDEPLDK